MVIYFPIVLDEGDECEASVSADEKSSAIVNALKGTSFGAVARGSLTHLERANIPCKSGLACARVSLLRKECTLESQDGKQDISYTMYEDLLLLVFLLNFSQCQVLV